MNEAVLTTIAITGFGVAFFHAAIPTHWLPFVLTARAQHWNHTRTLLITALAGGGHVLFTALLGLLIAWFGIVLNEKIGNLFPLIAGLALIVLGLFYIFRQLITKGHPHTHLIGGHPHAPDLLALRSVSPNLRIGCALRLEWLRLANCDFIYRMRYGNGDLYCAHARRRSKNQTRFARKI
jgi:hypothetical protein